MSGRTVLIQVPSGADERVRFAADELARYLRKLFGIEAAVQPEAGTGPAYRFILGTPEDTLVRQAVRRLPPLTEQGFLIRKVSPRMLVLAGGSATAVAWAVYELVERYGVRYLLHGDAFPEDPGRFAIPDIDETFEPVHRVRFWRLLPPLPHGQWMWSLEELQALMTQVFKLKYSGVHIDVWPCDPFVDYRVMGKRRSSWTLFFGQKIPIDARNIGRELLWKDMPFLFPPDFLGLETFPEALVVGRRFLGGIIDHARGLGMRASLGIQPLEFPNEFRGFLQKPTEESIQLGNLTCSERGDLSNPNHLKMIESILRAFIDQWGGIDQLVIDLPEHPHAGSFFQDSWKALARKYGLEPEFDLEEIIEEARGNHLIPGGPARAERELTSSISMLQFFDGFFDRTGVVSRLQEKEIDLALGIGGTSAPLYPFLHRILPEGCGLLSGLNYTTARAARQLEAVRRVDTSRLRAIFGVSFHDDNIGWIPQMATESIHTLLHEARDRGWAGFATRYFAAGELDPVAAYVSRASWDVSATPRNAYEDHFGTVYGEEFREPLCQAMRMLEEATAILDVDFMGLSFPVSGIMSRRVDAAEPIGDGLYHVVAAFRSIRLMLTSLLDKPGSPGRKAHLEYWIGRLDFGIGLIEEILWLHRGSEALLSSAGAPSEPDGETAKQQRERAGECFRKAVACGEAALQAMAGIARDGSDRSGLAAYYHFLVREVQERIAEVMGR